MCGVKMRKEGGGMIYEDNKILDKRMRGEKPKGEGNGRGHMKEK
jgi:hypothetical protein